MQPTTAQNERIKEADGIARHGDLRARRIVGVDYVEVFNGDAGMWEIDLSSGKVDQFERAARRMDSLYGVRRH